MPIDPVTGQPLPYPAQGLAMGDPRLAVVNRVDAPGLAAAAPASVIPQAEIDAYVRRVSTLSPAEQAIEAQKFAGRIGQASNPLESPAYREAATALGPAHLALAQAQANVGPRTDIFGQVYRADPAKAAIAEQAKQALASAQTRAAVLGAAPPPVPSPPRAEDVAPQGPAAPAPATAPAAPTVAQQAARALGLPGIDLTIGGAVPRGYSPKKAMMGAIDQYRAAEEAKARAEQAAGVMQADFLEGQADQAEQRMVMRRARQAEEETEINRRMGDLDAAIGHVKAQTFDSGRLMKSPAGVFLALGAALSPDGADVAMRALDRDFSAQQAEASKRAGVASSKANLVTQARAIFQDREQADRAAEIMHKDLAADQLKAMVARSQNPIIAANAQKTLAQLDESRAKLVQQWQDAERAKVGAMLAAREKREKELFERMVKLRELGIKETEVAGKAGDKAAELTKALETSKIPEGEAKAQQALAVVEDMAANPVTANIAANHPWLAKMVLGQKTQLAQQDWQQFTSAAMNALTGAGMSDAERARYDVMLQGASDTASRRRAITNVMQTLATKRANLEAGYAPEVVERARQRFQGAAPIMGPGTSAIPGFEPGVR